MALTNAERQKRHRQRTQARIEVLEQAVRSGTVGPAVDARSAAKRVLAAQDAAAAAAPDRRALMEAVQVGRCCRIWEEIAAGHTGAEEELSSWISDEPPLLWLFLSWVAEASGSADLFDEWCSRRGLLTGAPRAEG